MCVDNASALALDRMMCSLVEPGALLGPEDLA